MFVVLWQTGLLHASTHTMRGCHKMFHTLTAHPSVEWWRQDTRRVVQCGGSVLFCVAQKPQMPPAEQKKIYRLLNSGCHSFHRPAPSIIFWKMFHRHLTSLSRPSALMQREHPRDFLFPPRLLVWLLSCSSRQSRRERVDCWGEERRGEGRSSLVTLSLGCCPCSLCVWGTAFASAESAAARQERGDGIFRNWMYVRKDTTNL